MPIVAVSVKRLNSLLGKEFTRDDLVDSLEQLGCDVEDTAELGIYTCPACNTPNDKLISDQPPKRCDFCGHDSAEPFELTTTQMVIRIDLLAARPDLFDIGGLSRALKGFHDLEEGLTEFKVGTSDVEVNVDPKMSEAGTYRPYIVCAVVRMPEIDHNSLRDIMKLQENLHWGIGRDRKLASIGVYDLDTFEAPIQYTTIDPDTYKFCPLGMPGVEMTPRQVLEEHPKGIAYAHLMMEYKQFPALKGCKGTLLSMPPIINSEDTKLKIGSKNLFIDVTGLSRDAVAKSLDTLVSSLVELGGTVETVKMNYPDKSVATPNLAPGKIDIKYSQAKRWLGIEFTEEAFMHYLRKMRLNVTPKGDGVYEIGYPAFRTDIKHEVDVFEDLAIGYGFKNIVARMVPTMTLGTPRKEELLSVIVRNTMIGLNFSEVMSLLLQSVERQFEKHLMEPGNLHVVVENPKTIEQKVMRTHLLTGIMETLHKNRRKAVPQRIFEIGNVIHVDPDKETGTSEYRHVSFAVIGANAGFAEGRAVMDSLLHELQYQLDYSAEPHPTFVEGRCAKLSNADGGWALLGEINPQVLANYGLAFPVVYGELRIMQTI